jgi:hypothetical protein
MPSNEAVRASVAWAQHRSDEYFITAHPDGEPVSLVHMPSHIQEIIKDGHRQIWQVCTANHHLCSGCLEGLSQGPNFRRVIAE